MNLNEMITRRRSVRKYQDRPVSEELLDRIMTFCKNARPLYPDIQTAAKLVSKEQVRFYLPWKAPHLIAVYSENKPGYGENVGFLFQQVDLYIQSLGLGSCWMGLGKLRDPQPAPEGMEFVILIAFGHPADTPCRNVPTDFKRNAPADIADHEDPRLEPARLAPSSTNSQPWYFVHENDTVHAYCSQQGILRHKMLGVMNRIDMGIALGQLYTANPADFRFFAADTHPAVKGCTYIGSFTL